MGEWERREIIWIPSLPSWVLDMDQSRWASITVAKATVLYWLKDLDASEKHQEELGNLIHRAWDHADAEQVPFTVQDCTKIGRKHWESVRQNKLTLSRTNHGNSGNGHMVPGDSGTKTKKKKKTKEEGHRP